MSKLKRQHKKIKKWWNGYIDFSYISIEGYQYIKSTYVEGITSALITQENILIINELIPLFNEKESLFSRLCRLFNERRGKDKELQSSYLFRLYCNGFTEAYKSIDKKIRYSTDKLIFPSIKDCKAAVDQYIRELDDRHNYPTSDTKNFSVFRDYLLDLGEQEGALVRYLEYKQEYEETIEERDELVEEIKLKDLLVNLYEKEKDTLLIKVNDYLNSKQRKGKEIALLIKALQINGYLLELDKKTSFYSAIDKLVNYDTGTRASKDQYLRSTSKFDIEKESEELAKLLKVDVNQSE